MDADRAGLSERSRLVGIHNGGVDHSVTRTGNADEKLRGCHSPRGESKGECYGKRETLRNGDDDQSDGDDQDLCESDTLLSH